jgi:di/tricarboxylate transporter
MAAAIGLQGAVDHTGLAENIAHLLDSMEGSHPFVTLAAGFVGAVFLSAIVSCHS